ncbi:hypothetical protein BJ741DRAFT_290206 [Chytriomyces cf. hyalinus JEL632]|nr:hypothetical protein BJ741DRAFT_290206 [Chytriomyces cf. hyalinus JEL632]
MSAWSLQDLSKAMMMVMFAVSVVQLVAILSFIIWTETLAQKLPMRTIVTPMNMFLISGGAAICLLYIVSYISVDEHPLSEFMRVVPNYVFVSALFAIIEVVYIQISWSRSKKLIALALPKLSNHLTRGIAVFPLFPALQVVASIVNGYLREIFGARVSKVLTITTLLMTGAATVTFDSILTWSFSWFLSKTRVEGEKLDPKFRIVSIWGLSCIFFVYMILGIYLFGLVQGNEEVYGFVQMIVWCVIDLVYMSLFAMKVALHRVSCEESNSFRESQQGNGKGARRKTEKRNNLGVASFGAASFGAASFGAASFGAASAKSSAHGDMMGSMSRRTHEPSRAANHTVQSTTEDTTEVPATGRESKAKSIVAASTIVASVRLSQNRNVVSSVIARDTDISIESNAPLPPLRVTCEDGKGVVIEYA